MSENVCCPELSIVGCHDTNKHNHLYCDTQHTIENILLSNDQVRLFCLGDFLNCKYYPKGDAEAYRDKPKKEGNGELRQAADGALIGIMRHAVGKKTRANSTESGIVERRQQCMEKVKA